MIPYCNLNFCGMAMNQTAFGLWNFKIDEQILKK